MQFQEWQLSGSSKGSKFFPFREESGVVGWCEGVMYLTSPGCSTDIGLQLGKACYPCSR